MVIRDTDIFGEPPNKRHTEAREEHEVPWHSKRGKGRGGDLRHALQPMRVRIRKNMLVLSSGVSLVKGHDRASWAESENMQPRLVSQPVPITISAFLFSML